MVQRRQKFKENIEIDRGFFLISVLLSKKKYDNGICILTIIYIHVCIFILYKLVSGKDEKIVGREKNFRKREKKKILSEI